MKTTTRCRNKRGYGYLQIVPCHVSEPPVLETYTPDVLVSVWLEKREIRSWNLGRILGKQVPKLSLRHTMPLETRPSNGFMMSSGSMFQTNSTVWSQHGIIVAVVYVLGWFYDTQCAQSFSDNVCAYTCAYHTTESRSFVMNDGFYERSKICFLSHKAEHRAF